MSGIFNSITQECSSIIVPKFKIGDPAPLGYLEWFEWAETQRTGGCKQALCPTCQRWVFPSEKHCIMMKG